MRTIPPMTVAQLRELEAAKDQGFVPLSKGAHDRPLEKAFYDWCAGQKLPFVAVFRRSKLAAVHMDLGQLPVRDLTVEQMDAVEAVLDANSKPRQGDWIGEWTRADAVPMDKVDAVARELLKIWKEGGGGESDAAQLSTQGE